MNPNFVLYLNFFFSSKYSFLFHTRAFSHNYTLPLSFNQYLSPHSFPPPTTAALFFFFLALSLLHTVDGMSEISSLHDGGDPRNRGRSRPPQLNTVYDDENMSTISSVSQNMRRDEPRRGVGGGPNHGRARSMDNLDDIGRHYRDRDYPPREGRRG